MKVISQAATMIQGVNDFEAFVMLNQCLLVANVKLSNVSIITIIFCNIY